MTHCVLAELLHGINSILHDMQFQELNHCKCSIIFSPYIFSHSNQDAKVLRPSKRGTPGAMRTRVLSCFGHIRLLYTFIGK